ncbi:hypothetical protein NQ314_009738 [Rhamnusium bicolor]|uniref:Uncharacterized protein n=1 Tax=Rhamnusium bicolor TaxID=1586634 RepID=A0AAV8XWJ1_9CUCU|nr:hypothetical protein NQ314_009738 [Rhamnusium bicolor]
MIRKLFLFAGLVAAARGGVIGAPVVAPAVVAKFSDATIDPNPSYSFAYDVQDALTGDSKSQVESRANGIVKGQYTVADPDGTRRIVDYYADPVNGFNAVVRKTPLAVAAPVVAKAVAPPVVAPAPLITRAAPFAYAPGIARVAAPYAAAPAPLAVAPGLARVAAPYAAAPYAAAPYAAAPYAAAPAPVGVAPGFAAPLVAGPAAYPYAAAPFAKLASPYPYVL